MTVFYYDIDTLIHRVDTAAVLIARNIKKDRSADFQQLSTVDARDWIEDKIRSICGRLFSDIFAQYAQNLDETADVPYEWDVTYDDEPRRVVFRVEFPESHFDDHLIPSILQAGEDAIIEYVLYEWLYFTNYDYRDQERKSNEAWAKLRGLLGRRRRTFARTYKTI